jgi:HPt (histidine-containing phosphotransfer) domain-containing protein
VHSLKSVSAYIGAYPLSQRCATLEQHLMQGCIEPDEIIGLQQQLQQLMGYLLASAPAQPVPPEPANQACPLQQVWQQLYALLLESDFAAEQLIQQTLQRADLPPRLYQQLTQLATMVDAIEFEQAAELTKQWLENDQAVDY